MPTHKNINKYKYIETKTDDTEITTQADKETNKQTGKKQTTEIDYATSKRVYV